MPLPPELPLQRAAITQIHEIVEHDGLPYFSLEYVDGGSLAARLDGTPWVPRRSKPWPSARTGIASPVGCATAR
jgi:hypothetical protein